MKDQKCDVELCNGLNYAQFEIHGYVTEKRRHIVENAPDVKDNSRRLSLQHSLASSATHKRLRQETLRLPRRIAGERRSGALN